MKAGLCGVINTRQQVVNNHKQINGSTVSPRKTMRNQTMCILYVRCPSFNGWENKAENSVSAHSSLIKEEVTEGNTGQ